MANPSAGPKQGGVAPPSQQQCEDLARKNQNARKTIVRKLEKKKKKSKAVKAALKKAKGKGMAISSVNSQVPGARGTFTASSSGVANAQIPNGRVDGGTAAQRQGQNAKTRRSKAKKHDAKKKEAGVLCGQSHVHPGGGKGAHAECKIINSMTNKAIKRAAQMRGGSVLLNVDWRSSTFSQGDQSGMPCPSCYAMLCHAARECGIDVFICDHENKSQQLPKDCDKEGKYEELCEKIDGNPTPGRG
jgi:hypothetical protein